ncbi:MAG: hypothetical protein ACTHKV_14385, partial [Flavipsychrobacter sp.]
GLLDVEEAHIKPVSENMHIAGASSDMIVIDLGTNPKRLKVGDLIEFSMDYMGILRVMNSDYVEKRFEGPMPVIKQDSPVNLEHALVAVN